MENRRQYYRHSFQARQCTTAQFQNADAARLFDAEIVNLSIGGMCVVPETDTALPAGWLVGFSLEAKKMEMMVERVYSDGERPGQCGFRFLPAADLKRKEEQERAIWQFLLEKQRQESRRAREAV